MRIIVRSLNERSKLCHRIDVIVVTRSRLSSSANQRRRRPRPKTSSCTAKPLLIRERLCHRERDRDTNASDSRTHGTPCHLAVCPVLWLFTYHIPHTTYPVTVFRPYRTACGCYRARGQRPATGSSRWGLQGKATTEFPVSPQNLDNLGTLPTAWPFADCSRIH